MVIFYIFDANYIQLVPIKNRSKEELLRAYRKIYNWLVLRGFTPQLHKLDNETSHEVEAFIRSQHTHLQYTPPDMHCTNPAERAIRTWKNHFLSEIAGLPKSFPITNGCQLTTQCEATLNMLRPCHQNPRLSVHKVLEGTFSFDATPMAPLGAEVLVYMKPHRCKTWGYHAAKAWYLAYVAQHYRCIRVIMQTQGVSISPTPSVFATTQYPYPPSPPLTGSSTQRPASPMPLQAYRKLPQTKWRQSKPYARYSLAKPLPPNRACLPE